MMYDQWIEPYPGPWMFDVVIRINTPGSVMHIDLRARGKLTSNKRVRKRQIMPGR